MIPASRCCYHWTYFSNLPYLWRESIVLLGGYGHPGRLAAVVQDPQLAAALHKLIAVIVREKALAVTRCPHKRLQFYYNFNGNNLGHNGRQIHDEARCLLTGYAARHYYFLSFLSSCG